MHPWEHDHTFRQDEKKPGEVRTLVVVCLTAVTMVVEIVAGIVYGSMALLADGLHMASHATALLIAMVAYIYARRRARDERFSFGTGKVNSLAGYTGAILLAMFALLMAWESVARLLHPVDIAFDQALLVAFLGLVVNGVSVIILDHRAGHEEHEHHGEVASIPHDHSHSHSHDHNLRSAYLHVLADALTSLLAIFALLAGKYYADVRWLDPAMGIVGAVLVARWSVGLMRLSGHMLLDRQGPSDLRQAIRDRLERDGNEVVDLHLWGVGPGIYALVVSLVSDSPQPVEDYRKAVADVRGVVHVSIEVWQRSCAVRNGDSSKAAIPPRS